MKNWYALALLLCALLSGCATAPLPAPPPPAELFADALFRPPSEPVDASAIFALSEPMRHYLRNTVASAARGQDPRRALFHALYSKDQLQLEYGADFTRNASQAFAARTGNCLSLVIMTAALAKEMGLSVQYQNVPGEINWSRVGDLYFISGHVNVVLGRKMLDSPNNHNFDTELTIDFMPPPAGKTERTETIDEATVIAMYMNNRAAEAMAQDRLDDAYWWASAAVRQQPGFLAAYNTLGVVLRRHGDLDLARRTFELALERSPEAPWVIDNLAQTLAQLGRDGEAQALRRKLEQLQPHPPFEYFNLGVAAMRKGDYQAAAALFAREIRRDPYYHEFHFWLAQAHAALGDARRAEKELDLALRSSTTARQQQLYAGKLDRLRALPR